MTYKNYFKGRIWWIMEVFVAYFKVLFQYSSGVTKENHYK